MPWADIGAISANSVKNPLFEPRIRHRSSGNDICRGRHQRVKTPASRTFYSRFLPPSLWVPTSLFYFCCWMLRNIAKCFSFSPGSRHFGNPPSHPFSSRLAYPSRPPVPLHKPGTRCRLLTGYKLQTEAPFIWSRDRRQPSLPRQLYRAFIC